LRSSNRRAPQVLAVEFEEVERAEHSGSVVAVPADQVENGKAAFVIDAYSAGRGRQGSMKAAEWGNARSRNMAA